MEPALAYTSLDQPGAEVSLEKNGKKELIGVLLDPVLGQGFIYLDKGNQPKIQFFSFLQGSKIAFFSIFDHF